MYPPWISSRACHSLGRLLLWRTPYLRSFEGPLDASLDNMERTLGRWFLYNNNNKLNEIQQHHTLVEKTNLYRIKPLLLNHEINNNIFNTITSLQNKTLALSIRIFYIKLSINLGWLYIGFIHKAIIAKRFHHSCNILLSTKRCESNCNSLYQSIDINLITISQYQPIYKEKATLNMNNNNSRHCPWS